MLDPPSSALPRQVDGAWLVLVWVFLIVLGLFVASALAGYSITTSPPDRTVSGE